MKKKFENEFMELLLKYRDSLPAGEIVESIIGFITCSACSASLRTGELKDIESDLIEIVKVNVKKSKNYFEKNYGITTSAS